jgi:hypothetical protein
MRDGMSPRAVLMAVIALPRMEPRFLGRPARSLATTPTELSQLPRFAKQIRYVCVLFLPFSPALAVQTLVIWMLSTKEIHFFVLRKWRQPLVPKLWLQSTRLHGVISRETVIFIGITVETSNPMYEDYAVFSFLLSLPQ